MHSEWLPLNLSEIAEINPRRHIPKTTVAPFIDMAALSTHARDIEGKIVPRRYKGGGSKFKNGDTLVARITPCLENGKTALVKCLPDNVLGHGSTEFVVLGPRNEDDANFIYYLSRSADFRTYAIQRMEGTSGRQRVPNAAIANYFFSCPPIHERFKIGQVLSSLDDRIALLRETNKTLESIAQALFKSWFVDFDPVRAKVEGRQPEGMEQETAGLFPDSFEESEFGLLPTGWHMGEIQDLLFLQRGFDLPASQRLQGDYPIIAASGPSGTHVAGMAKAPGVITGRSGVLGKVFLELEDYWPLNTTLWVKEFRKATPAYAYELLRLLDFHSLNAGSAVPTLNRNHVHQLRQCIPDIRCIQKFEEIAISLHERVKQNQKAANLLSEIRDALLPRLISGQLRIPEAQELVENTLS